MAMTAPTPSHKEFNAPGIYYRWFGWSDGSSLWTLSLSLYYFVILSAILPALWLLLRSRQSRRGFPVDVRASAGG